MTHPPRPLTLLVVLSLLLGSASGLPAAAGGRVHGLLLDFEGRPAAGHALVLLDAEGAEVARGPASPSGHYEVTGVPRGTFTLVVEAPDGSRAAVATPPITVRGGAYRLNLKLIDQGDEPGTAVPTASGSWWGNLPTTGKVWAIAGGLAITAFVVAVIDDEETPASPF
jgi:hypothetical protein